jgi:hypothetical protein
MSLTAGARIGPYEIVSLLGAGGMGAEVRVLLNGNQPKYVASGHLVFLRENALWATAFDVADLVVTGNPVPVLEGFDVASPTARYDVSGNGPLYRYLVEPVSRHECLRGWTVTEARSR